MGSLSVLDRRIYNALINSGGVTYVVYPAGAVGTTLTGGKSYAYGAWANIVLAATVTAEVWLAGVILSQAAIDDFLVNIGTGTAPAGTSVYQTAIDGNDAATVRDVLPRPVRIAAGTGIVGRTANAAAGVANTLLARVILAWGM